ncbi:DnaJ domain-containing protein [Prosthecomicrobium pneumaticum]|uniref:J domain-containing protein n=1 Tax=Prosthecomicrobium pneumaticum TaxID=81895 RepID=A0A7W9FNW8_9HYPH|nr:DnaJ domain-containing protein [Prosthecomicrobium pneumaticum]MBB5754167.1 hypothetical protein [Prosthecomicrobium pneumaticum]
MGLIAPALALLALSVGLAFLVFGPKAGAEKILSRGLAGGLVALGTLLMLTGRLPLGIAIAGFGFAALKGDLPALFGRRGGGRIVKDGRGRLTVAKGRHAGKPLDKLGRTELLELWREVARSPGDRSMLEHYLDRRAPGWREHVDGDSAGRAGGATRPGTMTEEEAYQILGLPPGAGEQEIREAWRRLMKGVHPDQGGSTFLAAKLNEAKDRLLGKHR